MGCLCRTLRNWIDKQNSEFVDSEKEAKENILVARDKEKQLRQKMQDEVAKAIIEKSGASLSVSEHEVLVRQIKREVIQVHEDVCQAIRMLPRSMFSIYYFYSSSNYLKNVHKLIYVAN
ncbi:hypothetical protein J1N35_043178 [Gossypium stocksii]|uniref:Uncharacterized protein n=1 Tax=Gossypium stocksii TaxID=47602 RepID=A0A9D3U6U6_9ROSI|nr:hypothetical protein J1N35_043178 [Gossypium stocksii]